MRSEEERNEEGRTEDGEELYSRVLLVHGFDHVGRAGDRGLDEEEEVEGKRSWADEGGCEGVKSV